MYSSFHAVQYVTAVIHSMKFNCRPLTIMNYKARPFSSLLDREILSRKKNTGQTSESQKTPLGHCQFSEALRKLRVFRFKGLASPSLGVYENDEESSRPHSSLIRSLLLRGYPRYPR